jgi:hypothetical protein
MYIQEFQNAVNTRNEEKPSHHLFGKKPGFKSALNVNELASRLPSHQETIDER